MSVGGGHTQAWRSQPFESSYMPDGAGHVGGGTYTAQSLDPTIKDYENYFGPVTNRIKDDLQAYKRHGRWHLPDILKGPNPWLADRIDGLITDATSSPFTTIILPYRYHDNVDGKLKWNVWSFDEGMASRVPYEAAARTLTQSKRSFSSYIVRHGMAINLEHNFMMTEKGRQNFQNQLLQMVGSIQYTNDFDVHVALVLAPSHETWLRKQFYNNGKTPEQICREFVDLFGFLQKNQNALDILIEEAKIRMKTWGSPNPDFLLCNSKLGFQLNMIPERTNYLTQGPDGQKRLKQGPELNSYRGIKIINTRAFSTETGQIPRDILRRRVRVAEYYRIPPDAENVNRVFEFYNEGRDCWFSLSFFDLLAMAKLPGDPNFTVPGQGGRRKTLYALKPGDDPAFRTRIEQAISNRQEGDVVDDLEPDMINALLEMDLIHKVGDDYIFGPSVASTETRIFGSGRLGSKPMTNEEAMGIARRNPEKVLSILKQFITKEDLINAKRKCPVKKLANSMGWLHSGPVVKARTLGSRIEIDENESRALMSVLGDSRKNLDPKSNKIFESIIAGPLVAWDDKPVVLCVDRFNHINPRIEVSVPESTTHTNRRIHDHVTVYPFPNVDIDIDNYNHVINIKTMKVCQNRREAQFMRKFYARLFRRYAIPDNTVEWEDNKPMPKEPRDNVTGYYLRDIGAFLEPNNSAHWDRETLDDGVKNLQRLFLMTSEIVEIFMTDPTVSKFLDPLLDWESNTGDPTALSGGLRFFRDVIECFTQDVAGITNNIEALFHFVWDKYKDYINSNRPLPAYSDKNDIWLYSSKTPWTHTSTDECLHDDVYSKILESEHSYDGFDLITLEGVVNDGGNLNGLRMLTLQTTKDLNASDLRQCTMFFKLIRKRLTSDAYGEYHWHEQKDQPDINPVNSDITQVSIHVKNNIKIELDRRLFTSSSSVTHRLVMKNGSHTSIAGMAEIETDHDFRLNAKIEELDHRKNVMAAVKEIDPDENERLRATLSDLRRDVEFIRGSLSSADLADIQSILTRLDHQEHSSVSYQRELAEIRAVIDQGLAGVRQSNDDFGRRMDAMDVENRRFQKEYEDERNVISKDFEKLTRESNSTHEVTFRNSDEIRGLTMKISNFDPNDIPIISQTLKQLTARIAELEEFQQNTLEWRAKVGEHREVTGPSTAATKANVTIEELEGAIPALWDKLKVKMWENLAQSDNKIISMVIRAIQTDPNRGVLLWGALNKDGKITKPIIESMDAKIRQKIDEIDPRTFFSRPNFKDEFEVQMALAIRKDLKGDTGIRRDILESIKRNGGEKGLPDIISNAIKDYIDANRDDVSRVVTNSPSYVKYTSDMKENIKHEIDGLLTKTVGEITVLTKGVMGFDFSKIINESKLSSSTRDLLNQTYLGMKKGSNAVSYPGPSSVIERRRPDPSSDSGDVQRRRPDPPSDRGGGQRRRLDPLSDRGDGQRGGQRRRAPRGERGQRGAPMDEVSQQDDSGGQNDVEDDDDEEDDFKLVQDEGPRPALGAAPPEASGAPIDENTAKKTEVVIIRPNIEHYMLGIILGVAGERLGSTLWGQTELSVYDDSMHGVWGMSYKYHERAIVFNEKNLIKLWDIAYDGYNGGKDDTHVQWIDEDEVKKFCEATMEVTKNYNAQSMMVMAFAHKHTNYYISNFKRNWPSPILFDDRCKDKPIEIQQGYDNVHVVDVNGFRVFNNNLYSDRYKQYMALFPRFSELHLTRKDAGNSATESETAPDCLAFQGTMRIKSKAGTLISEITGSGHHGPDFVGISSVRSGKGYKLNPTPPSRYTQV